MDPATQHPQPAHGLSVTASKQVTIVGLACAPNGRGSQSALSFVSHAVFLRHALLWGSRAMSRPSQSLVRENWRPLTGSL